MQRTLPSLLLSILLGAGSFGLPSCATDLPSVEPGPETRCPVCGMFVAEYPNWIAQVEFQDGSSDFFDGPKDMFRYLQDIPRFRPEATPDQVVAILVTDYYALKRIDARTAFFVVGSDVNGPMGRELVPFETEEAADEFKADHHGEQILRFNEVDRDWIDQLN